MFLFILFLMYFNNVFPFYITNRIENKFAVYGGKKRALVLYNPRDPRPALWTDIVYPETYPMVELKAFKYRMGSLVAPNGYAEVITALHIPPQTICQFDDFGRCLVAYGKPLWEKRWHKKPHLGKLSRVGANYSKLASVKLQPPHDFTLGQLLDCSLFANCTHVKVSGITKGKGFAGAIKRHGFHRGPMSHGSKHHRRIGSVGTSTTPGRIFPGKRMPGRMGGTSATFRRLRLIGINLESNLIFVKGSVPGNNGSYLSVTTDMKGMPDPRFDKTTDRYVVLFEYKLAYPAFFENQGDINPLVYLFNIFGNVFPCELK